VTLLTLNSSGAVHVSSAFQFPEAALGDARHQRDRPADCARDTLSGVARAPQRAGVDGIHLQRFDPRHGGQRLFAAAGVQLDVGRAGDQAETVGFGLAVPQIEECPLEQRAAKQGVYVCMHSR